MVLSKDPTYQRIKARTRTVLGSASYWLAQDHLLVVDIESTMERYRRFNLEDLEAVIIRDTRRFGLWNVVLGVLDLFFVVFMILLVQGDQTAFVVCGIVLFILVVLTILNLVLGPTAYCELVTAVQTFRMPGVARRRDADRIAAALKAQSETLQSMSSVAAAEVPPPSAPPPAPPTPEMP